MRVKIKAFLFILYYLFFFLIPFRFVSSLLIIVLQDLRLGWAMGPTGHGGSLRWDLVYIETIQSDSAWVSSFLVGVF